MSTLEIATEFVALCKAGQFDAAGEKFWSPEIVSLKPMDGPRARVQGLAAVRAKGEWWYANHIIHGTEAHGPYVHGDQFAVRFHLDVTVKESGQRMRTEEIGLYTLRDGKIIEERFLFRMG